MERGIGRLGAAIALMQLCVRIPAQEPPQAGDGAASRDERAIGEQQIIADLVAYNQIRSDALLEYSDSRTYQVKRLNGKVHAQIEGKMEFRAPDHETFITTSEQGSVIVRPLALQPLIASEINATLAKIATIARSHANYMLELIGAEMVGVYRCYLLRAIPRRVDKYLFEGRMWVDQKDFAVVRIEGRPAAKLSFWIRRAEFVREYQKIDGFWLQLKDETVVDVRIYGKKVLTIDHRECAAKGMALRTASAEIR